MAPDSRRIAHERLAALTDTLPANGDMAASRLGGDVVLLGRLLAAAAAGRNDADQSPEILPDDVGAALGLFEDMRVQLDRLETQVVIEARRLGMDWRLIAQHQGLNSSQAASQRYQRLMTRLEEIRQGIR
ncbi:hypothetical protein [Streptomyces sp. NBC_00467]|uniref:hypothetical protein n=1 Tax=Streptomyces sp. NBC_00467 TaxID=2975752 RepID=UPI002E18356D